MTPKLRKGLRCAEATSSDLRLRDRSRTTTSAVFFRPRASHRRANPCEDGSGPANRSAAFSQKCTSKGIRRQGIVSAHRNSLQKSLCPVVICPNILRSSDYRIGISMSISISMNIIIISIIIIIISSSSSSSSSISSISVWAARGAAKIPSLST